ncbi:1163_t:CDS:2, partial [Funneliformis geosporum]
RDPNNFIKQQERDQLKKELCEENLIALRQLDDYKYTYLMQQKNTKIMTTYSTKIVHAHFCHLNLYQQGNVTSSRRDKAMSQQGEYVVCGGRTKIRHMSQHIHGQGKTLLEFLALRCTNADTRSSTQQIVKKSCSVILIK